MCRARLNVLLLQSDLVIVINKLSARSHVKPIFLRVLNGVLISALVRRVCNVWLLKSFIRVDISLSLPSNIVYIVNYFLKFNF